MPQRVPRFRLALRPRRLGRLAAVLLLVALFSGFTSCFATRHLAVLPAPTRQADSTAQEALALAARVAVQHGLTDPITYSTGRDIRLECHWGSAIRLCGYRLGSEVQFEIRVSRSWNERGDSLKRVLLDSLRTLSDALVRECKEEYLQDYDVYACAPPTQDNDSLLLDRPSRP